MSQTYKALGTVCQKVSSMCQLLLLKGRPKSLILTCIAEEEPALRLLKTLPLGTAWSDQIISWLTCHIFASSVFPHPHSFSVPKDINTHFLTRRSQSESWRWADTVFHNFRIWMLCSCHRPTHSAKSARSLEPLVWLILQSHTTLYSLCSSYMSGWHFQH